MTDEEPRPIFNAFPPGSEQDRQAREALQRLRDSAPGSPFAALTERVLEGRGTIQELFADPEMKRKLATMNSRVQQELREMTSEQREAFRRMRRAYGADE